MDVELLHFTPLSVADMAIGKCHDKGRYEGEKMRNRLKRVAVKQKHGSVIEHLVYSFDIIGISRGCLQELARHRIASLSVKSTRYTLKELKDASDWELPFYIVQMDDPELHSKAILQLKIVREMLNRGYPNDKAKYLLPESYKTELIWTINARSLRNFLKLRADKSAWLEIRRLAMRVYEKLPDGHKFLFKDCIDDDRETDNQAE